MQSYRPDPQILGLGPEFYDPVEPARFPAATLRYFNRRWAERIGLGTLSDEAKAAHFCRFEPLPGNLEQPLALRYHGHQFRMYNPDLGDGRGFLFAQLRDDRGRLLDLGTKGSGTTPYSRGADGRLTLKGGVREILATEMLEALGVTTSKTFALFETGEALVRGDEPSPTRSAVLTRLSHGHIRIGTFQRLAFFEDWDGVDRLVRYCLRIFYGDEDGGDAGEAALRLFDRLSERLADLAARYMASGFVHGVLNSDNIAVSGESFDYGPWRFAPVWDPAFTAAYFDHHGLYAFGRQPEAIQWNLAQMAGVLASSAGAQPLQGMLDAWGPRFERALVAALIERLGIVPADEAADRKVAAALVRGLQLQEHGIDRVFFDWRGGADPGDAYPQNAFRALAATLEGRARPPSHPYWTQDRPCSMLIDEVEAIWAAIAERDDWQPLSAKIAAIRAMGEAMRAPDAA